MIYEILVDIISSQPNNLHVYNKQSELHTQCQYSRKEPPRKRYCDVPGSVSILYDTNFYIHP